MNENRFLKKLRYKADKFFTKANARLLIELIRAKFKVNDHNSVLGSLWSLLGPICLALIMYTVFKARFGSGVKNYPLHLLVGVTSVNFFILATNSAISIFSVNRMVVLNSIAPAENFAIANVFLDAYKFMVGLLVCFCLSILSGVFTWRAVLLVIPLAVSYMALAFGVTLVLSTIYCFVRDVYFIWGTVSRLFLFGTPIFYTLESLSLTARKIIYWCNPLTPFVISFQEIFSGADNVNMAVYSHGIAYGIMFFILGYSVFFTFENMALERA